METNIEEEAREWGKPESDDSKSPDEMTLLELTEFLNENGGHLEGRGNGSVRWVDEDGR